MFYRFVGETFFERYPNIAFCRLSCSTDNEKVSLGSDKLYYCYLQFCLIWYVLFGFYHEVIHVACAIICLDGMETLFSMLNYDGLISFCYRIFLGRYTIIPYEINKETYDETNMISVLDVIRHSGWIGSVLLAITVLTVTPSKQKYSTMKLAACVTALEAIVTDLLVWNGRPFVYDSHAEFIKSVDPTRSVMFYCGNFGIIILHHLWFTDRGKAAFDVLEKMIQITMMRGAQSGGVITFQNNYDRMNKVISSYGIRSRCVNSKRTDLSKLVTSKVKSDLFPIWRFWNRNPFPPGSVTALSGHTRFATSSKASMDGTHPHQWTPPRLRRFYHMTSSQPTDEHMEPQLINVENYITHNGDFDFYSLNGKTYDLDVIQKWLVIVTGCSMPASVDSCAIAGFVDLLRTQGCFGLCARYAICLGLPTSKITTDIIDFPPYEHFEKIGEVFEQVLTEMLKASSMDNIGENVTARLSYALRVASKLESRKRELMTSLFKNNFITDSEEGSNIATFSIATINAFFDNDLFFATKTFLKNAKGSFGLCVTSSLDAHRQICLAARGQTMSIAFYPRKGLICYGSEQAAVKAGLGFEFPGNEKDILGYSQGDIDNDALRLDLDDLGGEIILIDWGHQERDTPPVSRPHRHLPSYQLMNGAVHIILYQESKTATQPPLLYHRMTRLSRNPLIKPLQQESQDLILTDIQDIPRVCDAIQEDWHSKKAKTSLNRLTAFNLSRCLRTRLEDHISGKVHNRSIDVVLTGCEVSLWLAEQFASDLQKAFPLLRIKAISSNKILGLFGQEILVPAIGFPISADEYNLHDSIVIIVSHSGGTFAPLSCSNLMQSTTKNIFVITSEWDTQIGKQLRKIDELNDDADENLFNSRIFSTEVGMRPAEPCSISVVATHQLLTNLFLYLCVVILSDNRFRNVTGAVITEQDLEILEKCNQMNIEALTEIVGVTRKGWEMDHKQKLVENELRQAGNHWAEHILENARAYIMTATYIFVTVTTGYPLFYAIAYASGLHKSSHWMYLVRFFDAAIYFWLPQINITIVRILQGRNLLHRMVGRTIAIADIPWVAQSAEAFLSKIFACSYSIAGLNVLSGNPADHFVHRHTHRVVRGTLLVCGRPDGRLSALSTAEASVCLSVNQASSIQSLGGTCESITIGHNPFKLDLSYHGIFLKRKRPLFLCERILVETDANEEREKDNVLGKAHHEKLPSRGDPRSKKFWLGLGNSFRSSGRSLDISGSRHDSSIKPRVSRRRSAAALLGAYMNFEENNSDTTLENDEVDRRISVDEVVAKAIQEKKWSDKVMKLFQKVDLDGDGLITLDDFVKGANSMKSELSENDAIELFQRHDVDGSGQLDYEQFKHLLRTSDLEVNLKVPPCHRDDRGIIQIEVNDEKYFGERMRKYNSAKDEKELNFLIARKQHFCQELYEARIASLQRFVAMIVMFHQMGKRVQEFFQYISFGYLGYRMDRTHSIMRIATTASPVSGADVRQRMLYLQILKKVQHSANVISRAYLLHKARKATDRVKMLERQATSTSNNSECIVFFEDHKN